MTYVSSTNLSHKLGVGGKIKGFTLKMFHVWAGNYRADW